MRLPRNRKPAALLLLWGLLFMFPPQVTARDEAPSEKPEKEATVPREEKTKGLASYYAQRYNGRKTYSGVRHDPEKLTAAHADLPMGTKVRVVNPATDSEVVVTVNDRCRRRSFPFIDLSRAAARKLGFLGKGTARVLITPLLPQ